GAHAVGKDAVDDLGRHGPGVEVANHAPALDHVLKLHGYPPYGRAAQPPWCACGPCSASGWQRSGPSWSCSCSPLSRRGASASIWRRAPSCGRATRPATGSFDPSTSATETWRAPSPPTRSNPSSSTSPPRQRGRLAPRRAERWLRPLVHPPRLPLLGFAGNSVPYWTLEGDRPSVALLEPEKLGVAVNGDGSYGCRFLWQDGYHDLPLLD